jgi:predicted naringenin-chalcone synthase
VTPLLDTKARSSSEIAGADAGRVANSSRPFTARLVSLGTAVPTLRWPQRDIRDALAALWQLKGAALDRWHRIVEASAIDFRHGAMFVDDVIKLTTAQRMDAYERHAGPLAEAAARKALKAGGINPRRITDLIVVSCTGFSAPGVDVELVTRLGLRHDVRRTIVGFMGCFGAISGLRTAVGACAADPHAVALVVCVELCSLHVRSDSNVQNQVASALFGDGAGAAIVAGSKATLVSRPVDGADSPIGRITQGASRLMDTGRDWMTWRITDAGFAMTLSRQVPEVLGKELAEFVQQAAGDVMPRTFIVHPGGPGILDAAEAALEVGGGCGLEASRRVLARIGNVSSVTVLFVLEQAMSDGCALPAMMLAFGPGLTIESLLILPDEQRPQRP